MRAVLTLLTSLLCAGVHAEQFSLGALRVDDPWARPTPPGAVTGAGYVVLSNTGSDADNLIAASSTVCDRVEIHTHLSDNGIMRMRQVESVSVPPGESVEFAPGGLHLMLIGLHSPLEEGQSFPLSLTFERGGTLSIEVAVKQPHQ